MVQDTTSFWIDIKKYEDILARDPNSYCFAPLAELYRKLGLLDDAIAIAERGCKLHPEFVSGCMALGRAYLDKGMKEEGKRLMEKVVRATPENLTAQKLLSQLCIEAGEISSAEKALQIILSLNPDDMESKVVLESLVRVSQKPRWFEGETEEESAGGVIAQGIVSETLEEEDFIIDDAELIEELTEEDIEEDVVHPAVAEPEVSHPRVSSELPREGRDPLTTGTLAELYVSQGFVEKAIGIYRELLQSDPDNNEIRLRLRHLESSLELEQTSSTPGIAVAEPQLSSGIAIARAEAPFQASGAKGAVETLEGWLENIRRRRHVI